LDFHGYVAWDNLWNTTAFCQKFDEREMSANKTKYEVWHGEWSLATDSCAHWLGGFNDGKANYGKNC